MQLSTKGRYAVTAMIDLAVRDPDMLVSLSDIADMQGISLSYLEQLFSKLRKHKIVTGVRGPGGGYKLAKSADEISIADIITAVDEGINLTKCDGKKNCNKGKPCLTHEIWAGLSDQIYKFLSEKSLQDVISDGSQRNVFEISQPVSREEKRPR